MKYLMPLLLLLFVSCSSAKKKAGTETKPLVTVQTETVHKGAIEDRATFVGEIEAMHHVEIYPKVVAKIMEIPISEMTSVEKGAIIITLDDLDLQVKCMQAKGRVEGAKAALQAARLMVKERKKDRERMVSLFEKGAVTEKQKEEADFALKKAKTQALQHEAELKQAQANEMEVKLLLEEAHIKAPISGIVSKKHLSAGNMASPSKPLVSIVDVDEVKILLGLPERMIPLVEKISSTEVSVDAYPGHLFYPHAKKIYPTVDPTTRMGTLELHIQNRSHLLRPGMFTKVTLHFEKKEDVPIIPLSSLIYHDGSYKVYICKEEKAVLQKVILGKQDQKCVEVIAGLRVGDELIVQGQHKLTDGVEVLSTKGKK